MGSENHGGGAVITLEISSEERISPKVYALAHRSGVERLSLSGCLVPGCDKGSLFSDGQGDILNNYNLVTTSWKEEGGRT